MTDRATAYEIRFADKPLSRGVMSNITRITYEERFFETARLEISIQDGSEFDLTPDQIRNGTKVECWLGYWGDLEKVFEGEIVETHPAMDQGKLGHVNIVCMDYSYWMKKKREKRVFTDLKPKSIAEKIIQTANENVGASVSLEPNVAADLNSIAASESGADWAEQIEMTDWEVLDKICHLGNYRLIGRLDTVYLQPLSFFSSTDMQPDDSRFVFVQNPGPGDLNPANAYPLIECNPRAGSYDQVDEVKVLSFDPVKDGGKEPNQRTATSESGSQGWTDIRVRSEFTQTIRVAGTARNQQEARRLAEAELRRRAEQLIKGEMRTLLRPELRAGQVHQVQINSLQDIGRAFSGKYTLNGVRHVFSGDQRYTEFDVLRDRLTQV